MLLLLIHPIENEKQSLIDIINKTFDGLNKLTSLKTKKNNFLKIIDEIPLLTSLEKYSDLFTNSVNETKSSKNEIIKSIDLLREDDLKDVGLYGESYKLKFQLYNESIFKLNSKIIKYADFRLNSVISLFSDELENLLNILESLKKVVPFLEPLVEILKALASLLKLIKKR